MEGDSQFLKPGGSVEHGFRSFEHGAADIILTIAFNSSGTRIVVGSADHRIRVYDIEQNNDWILVDQWRGHDAEVLDASLACSILFKKLCAEKMLRSIGLVLHLVKSLELLEVIISSNYGEKIPPKFLMEVGASSASFLSPQAIMFLMPHLASRLSSTRFG